jgi:hypothetical protein
VDWTPDEQFADFLRGGWWLEEFVKVDVAAGDPDGWVREAMVARFPGAPGDWERVGPDCEQARLPF